MRKNRIGALAIGLVGLAAIAVAAVPATSQTDLDARMADFGVPEGAEVVAIQALAGGRLLTVVYKDDQGDTHTIGGVERLETPSPK